jgi:aspartyl-tRNA(Asn)/glutamyl-tRNA(Gln) amidotransferase subunit B
MEYEVVIGLEVHTELATKSKIFCGCTTRFAGAPNTHVCPVCAGLPGALPVLNEQVVTFAITAGLATNCAINPKNRFDRKNYFYPDLPKAYQISQLYHPICTDGYLEIESHTGGVKRIGIREIHMEEDAGKLVHDAREDATLADFNRCGVPLLEIVSQPDFRAASEVLEYLEKLRAILQYTGVSDCKMQEGSFRADINLSLRQKGAAELGTRTEMKNLNSLRAIGRAIAAETRRQTDVLEDGGTIRQETRRWDDEAGESYAMRGKEDAHDYKYYPDPDLPPIEISDAQIRRVKDALPELPDAKKERYIRQLGLPPADADILTRDIALVRIFERVHALCADAKEASNWVLGEVLRLAKERGLLTEDLRFNPAHLADIIGMIKSNTINRSAAKRVFAAVFDADVDPKTYVRENNLTLITDGGAIETALRAVLAANEKSVAEYKDGKTKALQFLIGQSMKALRGAASAQEVTRRLEEMLRV